MEKPYYPIIYVRGYAMTRGEIDQTTADPFCGFNIGSTVYRATPDRDKPARKYSFESPVVRLMADFGYRDVFENGMDIVDPGWDAPIPARSIIIYHYYDQASTLLGSGKTPGIDVFAKGLDKLILRVRDLVCKDPASNVAPADFRCHLVAHSMGGLVCRAFLQNKRFGSPAARGCVDKVFTYATPHNGIDMGGFNVPSWLSTNDINNFNRDNMADYLDIGLALYEETKRVDWLPKAMFPTERFFCMIGTNRGDYDVAMGLSRTFSGHGGDGLVKIENASVWGTDGASQDVPAPRAYAFRSHSGYFGIVNSEEAYQNLIRFLFGNVRIDIWADVTGVQLPPKVRDAAQDGKDVNANYLFELTASPRGKLWELTRRKAVEDSAACRSHKELAQARAAAPVSVYLSTVYLGTQWRTVAERSSLAYSATLAVRVPDYEIDRVLWLDDHFEGGVLFQDTLVVEMFPPAAPAGNWQVQCAWQSRPNDVSRLVVTAAEVAEGGWELPVPFARDHAPGIVGTLRFVVSEWNA